MAALFPFLLGFILALIILGHSCSAQKRNPIKEIKEYSYVNQETGDTLNKSILISISNFDRLGRKVKETTFDSTNNIKYIIINYFIEN